MYVFPEGPARILDVTTRLDTFELLVTFKFCVKIEAALRVTTFSVPILAVAIFAVTKLALRAFICVVNPAVTAFRVSILAVTRLALRAFIWVVNPAVTAFRVPIFDVTRLALNRLD